MFKEARDRVTELIREITHLPCLRRHREYAKNRPS